MDVLIVGSGLAGIALTETLLAVGENVTVISSAEKKSSTEVATGMYNPLVFKRINHSWMIEDLNAAFIPFYRALSEKLGANFIQPVDLEKRIPSDDYAHLWNSKAKEEAFLNYILPVKKDFGKVLQAGTVDTKLLQSRYMDYLKSHDILLQETFDESKLKLQDNKLNYNGKAYDKVVLARGAHEAEGRLFGWLPFKLCKGEWIRIKAEPGLTQGKVINNVVNIIPDGEGHYKLSSTYEWEELDWNTTDEAKEQLCSMFEKTFTVPYSVVESKAGLRPTVGDRRPYLGEHPTMKGVYIFNGLGTKGVMLAPYFAQHLYDHILNDKPLMAEVNIMRHRKRFVNAIERHNS